MKLRGRNLHRVEFDWVQYSWSGAPVNTDHSTDEAIDAALARMTALRIGWSKYCGRCGIGEPVGLGAIISPCKARWDWLHRCSALRKN